MFILILFILILFPKEAQEGAREGLKIAFETVIPSVLPFAVVSSMLINSGVCEKLGRIFLPIAKILKINPYGLVVLMMGFLGGYPTGCSMVCDLYKGQMADKEECEKMLCYANNGGLAFALGICGKIDGWIVFFVSVFSAVVTAMMLGKSKIKDISFQNEEKLPKAAVLGKGVVSGGGAMLNIAASFVVFYAVINALKLQNMPLLEGVVEMTSGIMYAKKMGSLPLAVFFFTLGGVGILSQGAALCSGYNLKMTGYIKGKILSATVAFLVMCMITKDMLWNKEIVLLGALAIVIVFLCGKILKRLYADA